MATKKLKAKVTKGDELLEPLPADAYPEDAKELPVPETDDDSPATYQGHDRR